MQTHTAALVIASASVLFSQSALADKAAEFLTQPLVFAVAENSAQPSVVADAKRGQFVLSWQSKDAAGCSALKLATLKPDPKIGLTFGAVSQAGQGCDWFVNWADFPSVGIADNGDWLTYWLQKSGGSTYAYDIQMVRSQDQGRSWQPPFKVHSDSTQTEHGFVSLAPAGGDKMLAVWLDGRKMASDESNGSDAHASHIKTEHAHSDTMTLRSAVLGRAGSINAEALPGLGLSYALDASLTVFGGAHKGFNPPRVEDLIDNNGTSVVVDAEDSRQIEFGVRGQYANAQRFEISAFQNKFLNQVSVGSIAGGGVPLAQGRTLYRGLELSHAIDFNDLTDGRVYVESALTWLPTARQESALRAVSNGLAVAGSVVGNRLPYAPKHLASLRLGFAQGAWNSSVEAQHIGRQFADFANLARPTGNGQFGAIGGSTVFNATANWRPDGLPVELFLGVKNLTDRTYVADRTRGILFGLERHFQLGLDYGF